MNPTDPFNPGVSPFGNPASPQRGALCHGMWMSLLSAGGSPAWLRRCAAEKTVAIFERYRIGCGGSGQTGGITLAETASVNLTRLGDVLEGFKSTLSDLGVECDAVWNGVYEIAHGQFSKDSVLQWQDSSPLEVVHEVPGGTINPGRLLNELACAAERLGAFVFEQAPVEGVSFEKPIRLKLPKSEVNAERVVFTTSACSLEMNGLNGVAQSKLALALATEALEEEELKAIGLGDGKPFYTIDLPYLWGRTLRNNSVIFGCGLVHVKNWRELDLLDVRSGEPARLMTDLEDRVRGLHPLRRDVKISHRWGARSCSPMMAARSSTPTLSARKPLCSAVIPDRELPCQSISAAGLRRRSWANGTCRHGTLPLPRIEVRIDCLTRLGFNLNRRVTP